MNFNSEEPIISTIGQTLGGRGITLYGSNDPEELIRKCAEDLSVGLSDPFREEEFLVQSRGMNSWIKLNLFSLLLPHKIIGSDLMFLVN